MTGGQFVLEARRRAGMSQRQLAGRVGLSQPEIARIESGGVAPSFERVVELVRACGFDLAVRLVPLDEDAFTLAEQDVNRTPDERLARLLAGLDLYERAVPQEDRMADLQPAEIFAVLERHEVRYVLIGGLAAILYGAPHVTTDVDIVPEDDRRNLERLSEALTELNARIRVTGDPDGVPFGHDGASLARVPIWNLITDLGNLDISFMPSGTRGYEDLRRDLRAVTVRGTDVPVASLADVIRSKEAADRERDRAILPVLREILEHERSERNRRGRASRGGPAGPRAPG